MLHRIDFCVHVPRQRKLRWLCEEVQESVLREQRQRRQLLESTHQLNALRRSWESEKMSLQQCLEQQERMLNSFSMEKKGILMLVSLTNNKNNSTYSWGQHWISYFSFIFFFIFLSFVFCCHFSLAGWHMYQNEVEPTLVIRNISV